MSGDLGTSGLQGGGYEYEWKGIKRVWRCPKETMRQYDADGRIFYTRTGFPRLKRYLDEGKGLPMQDVWANIEALRSWHKERLGFPTQKPEGLLERIIESSSRDGEIVLDPFCGCGTAVAVAQKLNRRWIGIDITYLAINLIKHRLGNAFGDQAQYEVVGEPVSLPDARRLAEEDPYQFQWWALGLVGARPVEGKKGADKGIDGRLYFHDEGIKGKTKQVIFSVKAGRTGVSHLRDLRGVIEREDAAVGVLITMQEPTKAMRTEAAEGGFYQSPPGTKHPRLQILTVAELLEGKQVDMPPWHDLRTFKKAPKARRSGTESPELPFGG